jgi:hypothetical protein
MRQSAGLTAMSGESTAKHVRAPFFKRRQKNSAGQDKQHAPVVHHQHTASQAEPTVGAHGSFVHLTVEAAVLIDGQFDLIRVESVHAYKIRNVLLRFRMIHQLSLSNGQLSDGALDVSGSEFAHPGAIEQHQCTLDVTWNVLAHDHARLTILNHDLNKEVRERAKVKG